MPHLNEQSQQRGNSTTYVGKTDYRERTAGDSYNLPSLSLRPRREMTFVGGESWKRVESWVEVWRYILLTNSLGEWNGLDWDG